MPSVNIPIPPLELRQLVGPTDPEAFDNPSGEPMYAYFGLPLDAYEAVFDFGCGCGRSARRLLQQNPRPRRYVGIDTDLRMIDWCKQNLSSIDNRYQFFHHDVYSPTYAPGNSLRLAEPFPVQDGEFSLVIAHSVFTHLYRRQAEYYLGELARILRPDGVAFTTWLFFDGDSFPFLREGPFNLIAIEEDPTSAVIYDRRWVLDTLHRFGLGVRRSRHPSVAGHQWEVLIEKRTPGAVDQFPLGEEGAEWLCGATLKPVATPALSPELIERRLQPGSMPRVTCEWPRPPALFGPLVELERMKAELERMKAELERMKAELERMKRSWTWRTGRAVTAPARAVKRLLRL